MFFISEVVKWNAFNFTRKKSPMAKKIKPTPKISPRRRISWMQVTLVVLSVIIVLSMALSLAVNF